MFIDLLPMESKELYKNTYKKEFSKTEIRFKWIYENIFINFKGKKILEIGCGSGGIIQYLKDNNFVVGIDASKSGIQRLLKKGIKGLVIDLDKEKIPYEDNFFDMIIFIGTIEHLKNPQNCIDEIKRVLNIQGKLIVSIPNPKTGHYYIYPGLFEYYYFKEYLKQNGFNVYKFYKYGIRPPFYHILMKNKLVNKRVNKQTDNIKLGWLVYKLTNLLPIPKLFSWSWIFEAKLESKRDKCEEYVKEVINELY